MCLIAFAIGSPGSCPFLLASNRDEWWHRPTQPLGPWRTPRGHQIWSGRDHQAGGTWLGFNGDGRVAMLTNVRPATAENAPNSRGLLVLDWLEDRTLHPDLDHFLSTHAPDDYNGFNLVLGDLQTNTWQWLTNRPTADDEASGGPIQTRWWGRSLGAGIYGLSNASLDTPWAKTLALKASVAESHRALQRDASDRWQAPLLDTLMRLQADAGKAPSEGWEAALASPFVYAPTQGYGTRSSLVARLVSGDEGPVMELSEWTHPVGQLSLQSDQTHWPIEHSVQRRFSINTCGIPTSS